ncbi:MAG: deoxyribose-phosphate aldolase [Bacteroidales bacterium]
MNNLFENYITEVNDASIEELLAKIVNEAKQLHCAEVYKKCLSVIDYTTLNATDTLERGKQFAETINHFPTHYTNIPNVAAICVYPSLVNIVRQTLKNDQVKIAAVGAGFPTSQTYLSVKIEECVMAAENGADEIDIVISLSRFLDDDYQTTFDEVTQIKDSLSKKAHLKVILESGALPTLTHVRIASLMSMEAGADFIKTSTGKMEPAATPQAAIVMCQAIKDLYKKTGTKVGFKPAGGIVTTADAVLYYAIVKYILGEEWLTPELFRIGASRLANNLLSDIIGNTETYF